MLGTALDGVPESLVLGLDLLEGEEGSSFLIAVFLSNVPEAIAATTGLKAGGWPTRRIFGIWALVIVVSALSTAIGYGAFASGETVAFVLAFAAGAILTMLADTMMPRRSRTRGRWWAC